MEELHERYASRGLVVIGIHDSTATARQVIQFLKSRGVRYRVAVDTKVESQPTGSPTHDAYGVFSLPSLFLIDQQGIIRWTGHPLSPDIEQRLKFLLGG
jgi:peroxiredoxin